MLKTPDFWTKRNWISYLLLPLTLIYFCGFYLMYLFGKKAKISKPVICVGNLIAGGSGKTPTAIALGKVLQEMNFEFAFLSRGFMRDGSKFLMLRKGDNNKAEQVGDEPLLLIETAPTFVSQDRLFGARQIELMNKFDLIVLDDGMQNNSIKSDFYILVVDGQIGFGNEFLIPAGPMRQTIKSGLEKANLIVVIGNLRDDLREKLSGKKIIQARIMAWNVEEFKGKKLLAFCGLAYPQKFFSFLKDQNLEIAEAVDFPDHYLYRQRDLESLILIAERDNLKLITTKKDWVKFPKNFQSKISYLAVELEFEDVEEIKNELKRIL